MTAISNIVLLWVSFTLSFLSINAYGENAAAEACSPPRLTVIHPLDFGDVRVPYGVTSYLYIDPDASVRQGDAVLIVRDPTPGEVLVCGQSDQRVQIRLSQPSVELTSGGRRPVAQLLENVVLAGEGTRWSQVMPGLWEGRLPASGRARVTIGGTLRLRGVGQHGAAGTNIVLEVEPL